MSYTSRLTHAFQNAPILPLGPCSRYVLFSDCHRGNGTWGDNFLKNQNLYFTALKHYYAQGYTYIELGDGDELWENRRMSQIIEIHNNVFWLLSLFYRQGRLYLLYGNHDMEKKRPGYSDQVCNSYFCTDSQCRQPLFPGLTFYEGVILEQRGQGQRLYLTHGHQADPLNSTFWRLARFLVRYFWQPLEHFGVLDPTSRQKLHPQGPGGTAPDRLCPKDRAHPDHRPHTPSQPQCGHPLFQHRQLCPSPLHHLSGDYGRYNHSGEMGL